VAGRLLGELVGMRGDPSRDVIEASIRGPAFEDEWERLAVVLLLAGHRDGGHLHRAFSHTSASS
jgi:hypothetical protein